MATSESPSFQRDEVVEFLAAYIRHAHETATMVATFLKSWLASLGWKDRTEFPAEFLAQLGAILWIARWQSSESLSHVADEFPPASELFQGLVHRLAHDPQSFGCDVSAPCPLLARVSWIWHCNCAWHGLEELGVDVLLKRPLPADLIRLVVQFAWEHRHLSHTNEVMTDEQKN